MSDTIILKNEAELIKYVLCFLDKDKTPLKLCYRASLHGWSAQQFHKLCDGKTSTVVLIKVGHWIFGGYTDQSWEGKSTICYRRSLGKINKETKICTICVSAEEYLQ